MPRWLLLLVACAACSSPTSPSTSVAGTWAENFSFPGASLVFTLDSSATGTGTYAIEAGRSGTLRINGTVAGAGVTLTLLYDYGPTRTFKGSVVDANHLTGTFDDSPGPVVFTRR